MTLNEVMELRGSASMLATYKHLAPNQFILQFILKDGRKIDCNKTYRTKTQLMHDWQHNRYKFSNYSYNLATKK